MNIKEILDEKLYYFSLYEMETQKLYDDNIYESERHMEKRQRYAARIDELDVELKNETIFDEDLAKALLMSVDRDSLTEEYQVYFDMALKIKSYVRRIYELNDAIKIKMRDEMSEITFQIKEENKSSDAAYSKYAKASGTPDNKYSRTKTV
ncbi:hypothetical protein FACS1894132_04320 [Clostridia bacterium]|nr:hypothetical protein FACS1894132_04320 [Clostridia bacterium]